MGGCASRPAPEDGADKASYASGKRVSDAPGPATLANSAVDAARPLPHSASGNGLTWAAGQGITPSHQNNSAPAAAAAGGQGGSSTGGAGGCWDEDERLAAVRQLVATPPGDRFSPITALLRTVFDVPVATVSLIGEHEVLSDAFLPEEWKAVQRGESVSEWVLRQARPEMMIIEDLRADARFENLPVVAGPPHLRFYAAAPLMSSDGRNYPYGTLCILDVRKRVFEPSQYQMLAHFSGLIVSELERDLEVERGEKALREARSGLNQLTSGLDSSTEAVVVCHVAEEGWPVVYANPVALDLVGRLPLQTPFWQQFCTVDRHRGKGGQERLQRLVGKGQPFMVTCRRVRAAPRASEDMSEFSLLGMDSRTFSGASELALAPTPEEGNMSAAGMLTSAGSMGAMNITTGGGGGGGGGGGTSGTGGGGGGGVTWSAKGMLAVSFTPCTATSMFSDPASRSQPRMGIPLLPGEAAAAGGGDPAAAATGGQPYWMATLRPTTDAGRFEVLGLVNSGGSAAFGDMSRRDSSELGGGGGGGGADGPAGGPSSGGEHMMMPEAIREVVVGQLLGAGASGRTYRGMWQGSAVAVKIIEVRSGLALEGNEGMHSGSNSLDSGGADDTGASTGNAPLVEAVLSKALHHPHIVPTHAYGVCERGEGAARWKEVWILQELCTKGTLAKAVETGVFRRQGSEGPNLSFVLRTAVEVAGALAYLHAHGVLHGDLTGNNVLLHASTKDRRMFEAMIADFGLSRPLDIMSTLDTGTYGTVSHMPPELIIDGQLTTAADIFSFGVVVWEMLSGRRAWSGMNALQIVNAVTVQRRALELDSSWPMALQDLLRRCLHVDPAERPPAKQLLAELQDMLSLGRQGVSAPLNLSLPPPQEV